MLRSTWHHLFPENTRRSLRVKQAKPLGEDEIARMWKSGAKGKKRRVCKGMNDGDRQAARRSGR